MYKNREASAADTLRSVALKRSVDRLTGQIQRDSIDKVQLNVRVVELNRQISGLMDLLIDQRRLLRDVGLNVERSRKSNIQGLNSLRPPQPDPAVIPSNKVKLLPLPAPKRRGKFGYKYNEED